MNTIQKIQQPIQGEASLSYVFIHPARTFEHIDIDQRVAHLDKRLDIALNSIRQLEKERSPTFKSKLRNYFCLEN